ncbi:hypothetical protein [Pseudomonas lactis]|uniref:hypothetical protein n=1 Tax=Pseudomonas lactis TaxID=1615674 RepID=UPI00130EFBED|nr:hypothetical protein [Pseudomonas lactis]
MGSFRCTQPDHPSRKYPEKPPQNEAVFCLRGTDERFESILCQTGRRDPELFGVDRWTISATLQLWERPILTGSWAIYAPEYILGMNLLDLAINKDWPQ